MFFIPFYFYHKSFQLSLEKIVIIFNATFRLLRTFPPYYKILYMIATFSMLRIKGYYNKLFTKENIMMNTNKVDISIKLGKMIRHYREMNKLSQEALAFESGLHRTYIGQIERAEKNITIKNLEKIAISLNLQITDLFDFTILNK